MREWRVQPVGNGYRINEHRDNGKIVKVGETPGNKGAEAQLIAASPALLEGALAVLGAEECRHLPDDVVAMLLAATRKARGWPDNECQHEPMIGPRGTP